MGLSSWSVRRPVATTMIFWAIIAVGMLAFFRLKIDLLPKLDFPSIGEVIENHIGGRQSRMATEVDFR